MEVYLEDSNDEDMNGRPSGRWTSFPTKHGSMARVTVVGNTTLEVLFDDVWSDSTQIDRKTLVMTVDEFTALVDAAKSLLASSAEPVPSEGEER